MPARIEALALAAGLGRGAAHSQLASAVDVVVHLARGPDGARRVAQVAVPGRDAAGLVTMDVAVEVSPALALREGPAIDRLLARVDRDRS